MVSVTRLRGSDDVSLFVHLSDSTRNAGLAYCNRCLAHLVTQKSCVKKKIYIYFVLGSFLYVHSLTVLVCCSRLVPEPVNKPSSSNDYLIHDHCA